MTRAKRIEASARALVLAWNAAPLDADLQEGLLMDLSAAISEEEGMPAVLVESISPESEGDVDRGRPRDAAVNDSRPATGTPTLRGLSPSPATPSEGACEECGMPPDKCPDGGCGTDYCPKRGGSGRGEGK